ncbi:glycosyltransferase family protein [Gracilimonas mengyeensis]|uniref:Glycosyl transferase n=1 Tax=Gracilimonas mengyeensis TaxID=1302730 RepID=A0A521F685_9BACT|nr:glycosyltransferase family protein [Gracilimonas mengyeensis]SMO91718.1 conserved hypothetical protein [Gracilimonas mengyeensis]
MKILYGIQGTGHGHISRAKVLLPRLREHAQVDAMMSGYNFNMPLEGGLDYEARGFSLAYDNSGGVDWWQTIKKLQPLRFLKDAHALPVQDYDLVINDFEPVSAWAAKWAGIPCVAISHQASFLSPKTPRPAKRSLPAEQLLKFFAPASAVVGSHYLRYDDTIEPPIIRRHILNLNPREEDHVTVYLPAFEAFRLASIFINMREVDWHIFAPGVSRAQHMENVHLYPVSKDRFLESLESCRGVMTAAGFETTSEALYLGKRLLSIPIKNQYEQLCNAAALEKLGATVVFDIDEDFTQKVKSWLREKSAPRLTEISDEKELARKIIDAVEINSYTPLWHPEPA